MFKCQIKLLVTKSKPLKLKFKVKWENSLYRMPLAVLHKLETLSILNAFHGK